MTKRNENRPPEPAPEWFPWSIRADPAGIENLKIHDLRRSFGSWALSDGVPMEVVSRLLGHASIRTTEQVYAFLGDSPVRDGSERLGSKVLQFSRIRRKKDAAGVN